MSDRPLVSIAVHDITYFPRHRTTLWPFGKSESRPILSNNNVLIQPGCLTGILGPSGGGKTTLLNAIAGRLSTGTLKGSVCFVTVDPQTKQPIHHNQTSPPKVSYVMAKDRFLPGLTIEETVQYAAQLKLPHLSSAERTERVATVIEQVGLTHLKDAQIKSTTSALVGLGELKRLSLGVELLGDPSVIILDEPTSGLTTAMSAAVMQLLQKLAKDQNRTILCSIHQPRSSVFNLFDNIILLSDGCLAFHGPPQQLNDYFSTELKVKCPPRWSVADFALELIGRTSNSQYTYSGSTEQAGNLPNASSAKYGVADMGPSDSDKPQSVIQPAVIPIESKKGPFSLSLPTITTTTLTETYNQSSLGQETSTELQSFLQQSDKQSQFKCFPSSTMSMGRWFKQCGILIRRQFRGQSRDTLACLLILAISLLQGLFIGAVFWQLPRYADSHSPIPLSDITQMVIPYDAPWFSTLIDGVDGEGFQPIFEMIDWGDNGRGRSIVDTLITDADVLTFLTEGLLHLYDSFDIEDRGYPSLEWLDEIIGDRTTEEPGTVTGTSDQRSTAANIENDNRRLKALNTFMTHDHFDSNDNPQNPTHHAIQRFLSQVESAVNRNNGMAGNGFLKHWLGHPQIKQMLNFIDAVNIKRMESTTSRSHLTQEDEDRDANFIASPVGHDLQFLLTNMDGHTELAQLADAWLTGDLTNEFLTTSLTAFAVDENEVRSLAELTRFILRSLHLVDWIYFHYDWAKLVACDAEIHSPGCYYRCLLEESLDLTTPLIDYLQWPDLSGITMIFALLCALPTQKLSGPNTFIVESDFLSSALSSAAGYLSPHISGQTLRRLFHMGEQYKSHSPSMTGSRRLTGTELSGHVSKDIGLDGLSVNGAERILDFQAQTESVISRLADTTTQWTGTGTTDTETSATEQPLLPPSWIASVRINEKAIRDFLERYQLTGLITKIFGDDLFHFINPLNEVFDFVALDCSHPICKGGMDLLRYVEPAVDLLIDFISLAYDTLGTMFNISGVLFFVSLFLGFAGYDALLSFQQQRPLFNKETASGLYCPSAYYVAKTIADLPFQFLPSFVLGTSLFFMVGLHRVGDVPVEQYFVYLILCFLVTFSAYGFGYMISAWSARLEVAVLIAPVFVIVWLCIAGFFLREGDLPSWISWFNYLSFYRWGFCGHVANMFRKGTSFGSIPNELNLAFSGIIETRIWLSGIMLFVLGLCYRLVGFIGLKYSNRSIGLQC